MEMGFRGLVRASEYNTIPWQPVAKDCQSFLEHWSEGFTLPFRFLHEIGLFFLSYTLIIVAANPAQPVGRSRWSAVTINRWMKGSFPYRIPEFHSVGRFRRCQARPWPGQVTGVENPRRRTVARKKNVSHSEKSLSVCPFGMARAACCQPAPRVISVYSREFL